jgi:hypothetical protein
VGPAVRIRFAPAESRAKLIIAADLDGSQRWGERFATIPQRVTQIAAPLIARPFESPPVAVLTHL